MHFDKIQMNPLSLTLPYSNEESQENETGKAKCQSGNREQSCFILFECYENGVLTDLMVRFTGLIS